MGNWNKDYPQGDTVGNLIDNDIRDTKDYLETALSHEHTFPGSYGSTSGKHSAGLGLVLCSSSNPEIGNNALGFNTTSKRLYTSESDTLTLVSLLSNEELPSGTRMLFFQSGAPTGWSIVTSFNDAVIWISSSADKGGTIEGSWTITGFSGPSHTHTCTLPQHKHETPIGNSGSEVGVPYHSDGVFGTSGSGNRVYQGSYREGAQSGPTALTSPSFTGDSSFESDSASFDVSHDGSWRPKYITCIVGEKD